MEFTSSGIRVGLQHFLSVVLVIQLDFESPLSVEIDLILLVPQQRDFMFFFFIWPQGILRTVVLHKMVI